MRVCTLITILTTTVWAAPALKQKIDWYVCTVEGATLVYIQQNGETTTETTHAIEQVVKKDDGIEVHSTATLAKTGRKITTKYFVNDGGLFRTGVVNKDYASPMLLLKVPVKKDETWENKVEGVQVPHTCRVLGEESIEVPAGTFKAIGVRATYETKGDGGIHHITYWHVPNIGLIKSVTKTNDGTERTQVLKSFQLPKK